MQLRITPAKLVSEVQAEFNTSFPFLKLEFFQNKFQQSNTRVGANKRIGDCQTNISDGEIEISGDMKVNELEKKFKDQFALNVQVYRKSGSLWLQTTMTDGWSLEKQNEHGMELAVTPKLPAVNIDEDHSR